MDTHHNFVTKIAVSKNKTNHYLRDKDLNTSHLEQKQLIRMSFTTTSESEENCNVHKM